MAKKNKQSETSGFENVEQTLSRTEQFIEDNYKQLLYGLAVVVVVVGAFWLLRMRANNKTNDAFSQMYVAEKYFESDSLNLALYGDGNYLGFIDIATEYRGTKPGNLANYYAGVCLLHSGEFESAIEYFSKYDKNDEALSPLAFGCTGDAYIELGDIAKGLDFYMKAVAFSENDFYNPIYLLKAGQVYELEGDKDKALEMFKLIQDEYPESNEGTNIQKYIARVSN